MESLNNVEIHVFCKEGESEADILGGLKLLVPLDFEKEKIRLERKTVFGFDEKKIIIIDVSINKNKQIRIFIDNINKNLSQEQKDMIIRQAESRLDHNLDFFLRFDKDQLINEKSFWITDKGNCYHVRMNIVAFPKRREIALEAVRNKIFK